MKSGLDVNEIKRLNEIVCGLIVENMKAGSDYKKAKTQAYNRMKKECPEILSQWLKYHK